MALVGTDGRFLRVNNSLCEILGYSEQELLNKTFQNVTHQDDVEDNAGFVRRALAGELRTYQTENRYLHKDGQVVCVVLSASLVRDAEGSPLHFVAQIQDITERKQAEEELRAAHQKLSSHIENSPLAVLEWDQEVRILVHLGLNNSSV